MPAAHGPNAAFVARPTRFQGRQATAPSIKHVPTMDMTEDDDNLERLINTERCIRCTKMFREEDNADDSCNYHPGPTQTALRNQNHLDRVTYLCCGGAQVGFSPVLYDVPPCKVGKHISAEAKQKMLDARRAQRAPAGSAAAAAAAPAHKVSMGFGSSAASRARR